MGSTGMFCGFAALQFLPLSEAVAIGYAAPLAVVVLAALVLKERVRIYRWSAVTIGFVGVLIMLSPISAPVPISSDRVRPSAPRSASPAPSARPSLRSRSAC